MSILRVFGEPAQLEYRYNVGWQTSSTNWNRVAYSRGAISIDYNAVSKARAAFPVQTGPFWIGMWMRRDGGASNPPPMWFAIGKTWSSGEPKIGFRNIYSTAVQPGGTLSGIELVSYNGAAMTSRQFSALAVGTGVIKWDFYFDLSQGIVRVYVDGLQHIDYQGPLSSDISDTDYMQFSIPGSANNLYISEVIVATDDTRTLSVATLVPTSTDGASQWTGGHTQIDEAILDPGDVAYSGTQGQRLIMGLSDLPAGQFIVRGVSASGMLAKGVSGPGSVKLGIRSGANVHLSAEQTLAQQWEPKSHFLESNPSTGERWTTADVNAMDMVVETGA